MQITSGHPQLQRLWFGSGSGQQGVPGGRPRHEHAAASGCESFGGGHQSATSFKLERGTREGQEGQEELEELEEKRKETSQEKEKESEFSKFKLEQQEPVSQQFQQQQQQFGVSMSFAMERTWEGQAGSVLRHGARRRPEVEEERGLDSLCRQACRSSDCSLSGEGLCAPFEGNIEQIITASRGIGGGLGSPVHRAHRDPGHQKGLDACRDLGLGEPSRDRQGFGHPLPTYPGNSGGEDEEWQLGEGRGHRVDQHTEVSRQQRHAGPDKRLTIDSLGRHGACARRRGLLLKVSVLSTLERCPVLADAVGGLRYACSFGQHLRRIKEFLHGMSVKGCFSSVGGRVGCSPARVFPLPPFSQGGRYVDPMRDGVESSCKGFAQGANLVVAAFNYLHGGQWSDGEKLLLSAAHRLVHARIAGALEAMVLTDEPVLSSEGLGLTSF